MKVMINLCPGFVFNWFSGVTCVVSPETRAVHFSQSAAASAAFVQKLEMILKGNNERLIYMKGNIYLSGTINFPHAKL